ncbi:threonine synthase [Ginsengibacter hankyongi]|uniref:Threonine synthase n=1 Tax=Ginsengibacter hankyongi TaxID=2607284 RepID=A0A5J5IHJ8_9BACT|nr:threonine synthase [Ginsengibacter hankyongi]KAA9038131.1 threonine synthase [Ginsengibacter hankyongi]
MLYFSTNNNAPKADFKEATIKGQAPDKGLYFPETVPVLDKSFIDNINKYSKEEIAFKVIQPYIGDLIPKAELERIVAETINFDFPLVKVEENIFSLELFHGPTLAFKDVGARFMSRCLGYFVKDNNKKVTVLVATSGDTGGAVANGFYDVDGVDVVILYPSGKVSSVQELQLTTLGKNIKALEIDGTFDDCQQMVKQAFADGDLNKQLFLTSANSINVARWLPQQFYYFFAYTQWADKNNPPVISVPSGNFGNICAGLLAHRSGLPVSHFIAACNVNNVVTEYLETGNYSPKKSVATLSNAMDVGNPSNFVRILELFDKEFQSLKNVMSSYSFSDEETKNILKEVYLKDNYLLDPHGAVGYGALKKYLQQYPHLKGMFLETAHPVKFYDVVEPIINEKVPMPSVINDLFKLTKKSVKTKAKYEELKEYLLA